MNRLNRARPAPRAPRPASPRHAPCAVNLETATTTFDSAILISFVTQRKVRKQMVYIDGSSARRLGCGRFRRALLPESREVARGGSATSRRSFSSNVVPTPRWRRLWAGSDCGQARDREQGAGRRGACAGWMRSTGRRAGRRERRFGDGACAMVCGRGSVCGKGMRVDGEALASPSTLICAGEAPAFGRRRWTPAAGSAAARGGERGRGATC